MTRLHKNVLESVGAASVEFEGATETVVATLTGITTDIGHGEVFLEAQGYWTQSAETGGVSARIRRGTGITGTEVVKVKVFPTVGKEWSVAIQTKDVLGQAVNASYVLTLQEAKAAQKPKAEECRLKATF